MGTYIHVTYSDDVETEKACAADEGARWGIRVDSIIPIKNFGMNDPGRFKLVRRCFGRRLPRGGDGGRAAVYFFNTKGFFETVKEVTLGLAGTLIAFLALGMTHRNYLIKPPSTASMIFAV
jgi:hypothetical protein